MKHPWCTAIIPQPEQEEIQSGFNRLTLSLLMMSAVVSNVPEYFEKKCPTLYAAG